MRSTAPEYGPRPLLRRPPFFFWLGLLAVTVPLLTGLLLSWHSLGDLDIWFHLRAGRDLLGGQAMPLVNHYSFTEPDHPWVNHEWMFQVLAAVTGPDPTADNASGIQPAVTGWNLLRSLLTVLLMTVILWGDRGLARLRGSLGLPAAAWAPIPLLVGLMLLWPRLTLRPELISYTFFVLLVRNAEQFFGLMGPVQPPGPPKGKTRPWWAMVDPRQPAGRIVWITVIWAQFHGFASLVPVLIFLCLILAPLQKRLWRLPPVPDHAGPLGRQAVILLALTVVALMVTPNGWNGLLMPLRAVGQFSQNQVDLRTTISELVPLIRTPNSLGITIGLFKISVAWGLIWMVVSWGRISLLRILVFGLAAGAAWTNQRSIGIYAIAFMLLHTGLCAGSWRIRLPSKWSPSSPVLAASLGMIVTVLFAGLWWPQIVQDDWYLQEGVGRRFGSGTNPARYPVTAAASMGSFEDRPFFANLDAAAFLLAHTKGRTFIDGRTEAYSPALWAEYLAIKRGDERSLGLLARRRVEAVCLAIGGGSFDRLAAALLASDAWNLVAADGAGLLFRPNTGPPPGSGSSNQLILAQAADREIQSGPAHSGTRRGDHALAAGQLAGMAGMTPEQEMAYRTGLTHREDHPTLNHNLGNLLLDRQKFREALSHFQTALKKNPRLAGSALNAGVCQMRLGQPQQAARSFGRAAAIDPTRPGTWANLAAARMAVGDRAGAARALEKAVQLSPNDARLQQRLRELKRGAG